MSNIFHYARRTSVLSFNTNTSGLPHSAQQCGPVQTAEHPLLQWCRWLMPVHCCETRCSSADHPVRDSRIAHFTFRPFPTDQSENVWQDWFHFKTSKKINKINSDLFRFVQDLQTPCCYIVVRSQQAFSSYRSGSSLFLL